MWGIAWVISRMERNPGDRVLLRPGAGSDYADSELEKDSMALLTKSAKMSILASETS